MKGSNGKRKSFEGMKKVAEKGKATTAEVDSSAAVIMFSQLLKSPVPTRASIMLFSCRSSSWGIVDNGGVLALLFGGGNVAETVAVMRNKRGRRKFGWCLAMESRRRFFSFWFWFLDLFDRFES